MNKIFSRLFGSLHISKEIFSCIVRSPPKNVMLLDLTVLNCPDKLTKQPTKGAFLDTHNLKYSRGRSRCADKLRVHNLSEAR